MMMMKSQERPTAPNSNASLLGSADPLEQTVTLIAAPGNPRGMRQGKVLRASDGEGFIIIPL